MANSIGSSKELNKLKNINETIASLRDLDVTLTVSKEHLRMNSEETGQGNLIVHNELSSIAIEGMTKALEAEAKRIKSKL